MKVSAAVASTLVKAALRASFKLPSRLPIPLTLLRSAMEGGAALFRVHPDVSIEAATLAGVSVEYITPLQADRVLLHFHGGAFFAGSANTHRALGSEIAVRAQSKVVMVNYRRAPEYAYPAAMIDGLACYQALLDAGWLPSQISFGGDSGGCAIILSMAQALRDRSQALPAALLMISPYVDITLSLPSVTQMAGRDPMVTAHALRRGGDSYRGDISASDPRVSPLFGSLRNLPPMLVQAGSEEILLDDARRLARYASEAGVEAQCHIYPGMWHNLQMFSAFIEDANLALDEIAAFIRSH